MVFNSRVVPEFMLQMTNDYANTSGPNILELILESARAE